MKNIEIKNPSDNLVELFSLKEWRQQIHLFDNVYTPGTRAEYEWEMCSLPNDLGGKSFIDVGSNDGMFSFLAEKKNAGKILSVDLYIDEENTNLNMTHGWPIGRIKKVKAIKNSNIDVKSCSIYELNTLGQQFDIVYCSNVIAWLNSPTEALGQLSGIAKKQLIIREDISRIKGRPALEYVNNKELTGCMYNGNEEFYRMHLTALGYKKITFKPVDEYKIFELRHQQFPKHDIAAGIKIYENPFSDNVATVTSQKTAQAASVLINSRHFFNTIGWINEADTSIMKIKMIPENAIKRRIFENKFRKNMLQNCMIFAEK